MKKMILMAAVMVFGSIAFGRDFDHRERMDLAPVFEKAEMSQEMVARERSIAVKNAEDYADYHWELMHMDRGHEDK